MHVYCIEARVDNTVDTWLTIEAVEGVVWWLERCVSHSGAPDPCRRTESPQDKAQWQGNPQTEWIWKWGSLRSCQNSNSQVRQWGVRWGRVGVWV